jgi:hypothetical protein
MLNKRIMSLSLAALTTASLATSALAATVNTTMKVSAAYKTVTINVTVPTADVAATINPYALPIEIAKSDNSKVKISGQIVTTPTSIANDSDFDLSVGATVTTAVTGVTLSSTKLTKTNTGKDIYAQLQLVASSATGEKTTDADSISDTVITESAKDTTWDSATSVTLTADAAGVTKDGLVTLKAATLGTTTGGDSTTTYNKGSVALVRVTGSVVESPSTAWAEADKFVTTIAYTFKPASST